MELEIFTPQLIIVLLWLSFGKFLIVGIMMAIQNWFPIPKIAGYDTKISYLQTIRELKSAWVVLTDTAAFAILIYFGLLKLSTEAPAYIFLTFIIFFVWVEVWFYWTHRWMHEIKFLWQFHEHHHLSILTQPLTAISFSFIEKFIFYTYGWFLLPTLLSWYIPISAYGIAAYFTFYYIFSAAGHFNREFLYSLFKYLPSQMNNISSVAMGHGIHHIRYDVNYGLITPVFDYIFRTHASDTEESIVSLQEVLK